MQALLLLTSKRLNRGRGYRPPLILRLIVKVKGQYIVCFLFFVVAVTVYGVGGRDRYSHVIKTSPIAHWKMNDNAASATVVDEVGNYNGTYKDASGNINTSTGASAGRTLSALALDGDEWVDIGTGPTSVQTISFWVKQDDVAGVERLLALNSTDFIATSSGVLVVSGFATLTLYVDGVLGTNGVTTITTGWHHIVLTASAAKNASDFDIGREGANYMEGLIDNVMLFDRILSVDEITFLYNSGRGTEILQLSRYRNRYLNR